MLQDDLRGVFYITIKDLKAYYFKPPNISWGVLFPFAFILAFAIRNPTDLQSLVPGLLSLTLLFGSTSMEAIVIVFERRVGSLERLFLAPIRLPAVLAGKLLGGVTFGITVTLVVLVIDLLLFGTEGINWLCLITALLLSALTFSALGALISVSVREVFEAQTLANLIRFPMMFLGGVFVPLSDMPAWLQVVARCLPLTYSVEVLRAALNGEVTVLTWVDMLVLLVFSGLLFWSGTIILSKRLYE
ncbi:MAG: hypothetical protein Kow0088_09150 [Anaerolineales bacterium]